MANKQLLLTLWGYNEWANQRIFAAAEKVTDLGVAAADGQRNLQELLFHIVRTEWVWRYFIQHGARPATPPQPAAYPNLAALRAFSQEEVRLGRELLEKLSEAELDAVIHFTSWDGQPAALIIWQAWLQALLHGVQHRSEASLILTQLGQSPGDIDFVLFVYNPSAT